MIINPTGIKSMVVHARRKHVPLRSKKHVIFEGSLYLTNF